MSAVIVPDHNDRAREDLSMSRGQLVRAYLIDTKYEFLRVMRAPSFTVPVIVLPVVMYWFIGIVIMGSVKVPAGAPVTHQQMLNIAFGNFAVFGIMGPAIATFGVLVAVEREMGLLDFKRASPMPPSGYLLSKLAIALMTAVLSLICMTAVAVLLHATNLTASEHAAVFAVGVLGVLPFCAIGLALGASFSTQTASSIVNILFIAMAILGGLFFQLPPSVARLSIFSPAFYVAQLNASVLGLPTIFPRWIPETLLSVITLVLSVYAVRRLNRSDA